MEKVGNYIPNDLIISILSKLPLKSLKRFECVQKSWIFLLKDSHFMNIYRKKFMSETLFDSDDRSYLMNYTFDSNVAEVRSSFYFLSGERLENKVKIDYSLPFEDWGQDFIFVGSCSINGIVGIVSLNEDFALWNPTTDECKVIPHSATESVPYRNCSWLIHGFGYDHVKDDYKVLRRVSFYQLSRNDCEYLGLDEENVPWKDVSYESVWEIYSLRSDSWRELNINIPMTIPSYQLIPYHDNRISRCYSNGMCHSLYKMSEYIFQTCLMSFEVSNEVVVTTPMPSYMNDNMDREWNQKHLIMLIKGFIALSSYHVETNTIHISILNEIGVKESWIKFFILGPLSCVAYPFAGGKNGDLFLRKNNEELIACFDLDIEMVDDLGFQAHISYVIIYNKSLLSIRSIHD
ncbi:unnamed protein product [Vicia faba]|uniref:F-box associated beta-propeller type 1 domain-containing protein n=1 Tax=Vicia faba TaxID=3906 RepID=A0AAV0YZA5_VICFA|nr:unnamed protein product [Vicia faba]CAI8591530.1 unnamed protein product [Vicia faba]CAI8591531.1 unnamed protein product [Vicia faba]